MSVVKTKWIKKQPVYEYSEFEDIKTQLARIHGIKDIKRFLNPSEFELHSPYLLKNIESARDRIVLALKGNENIAIHIDIDSDGCCSGSLMFNQLRHFTDRVTYFHAQRSEGHGVEISEMDIPLDTNLLIVIDSSTNSVESCKRISEQGIDVIVLDHHEQDYLNPYCILVNPQQKGCRYPNKAISGAVVAWKVCQALDDYYKTRYANEFYDLVAIGLVGDVMSLVEHENRYIVREGINNIRNIGIRALLKESKKDQDQITVTDIGYLIAPNINAACRLDRIEVVLNLLTETDKDKAKIISKQVLEMNEERKIKQQYHFERLWPLVDYEDKCSIIIDNEIGKGYRGLVAGVLCEEFQKPIIIMSEDSKGIYSGSFRSYEEMDFKQFLNNIPQVIEAAGHKTVGGVRFKCDDLKLVRDYLNLNLHESKEKSIEYVLELNEVEITSKLVKDIQQFYSISGHGFETGRFLINNLIPQKKEVIGKNKNTVKVQCENLTLMKFRTDENYFDDSVIGNKIEAIGTLNLNEWTNPRTRKTISTNQLFIEDYQLLF